MTTKETMKVLIKECEKQGRSWVWVAKEMTRLGGKRSRPWSPKRLSYVLYHHDKLPIEHVRLIAEALGFEIEVTLKKGETVYALRKG